MLAHVYRIIVYHCVGAPGHGREVVDGLNATNKSIISMLMENVQLPGAYGYDTQIKMHTSTQKYNISLAREFQKHLSEP